MGQKGGSLLFEVRRTRKISAAWCPEALARLIARDFTDEMIRVKALPTQHSCILLSGHLFVLPE